MKIFLIAIIVAVILGLLSNRLNAEETQVPPGYFTPDRIIDVSECLPYIQYGKSQFVFCMNVMVICESDVIKNPKGEEFGIKLEMPRGNGGSLWKSGMLDTETKQWCGDWHKRNPGYRPKSMKSKNPKTII